MDLPVKRTDPDMSADELDQRAAFVEGMAEVFAARSEPNNAEEARDKAHLFREMAEEKRNEGKNLQSEFKKLGYSNEAAEELAGHVEALSPSSTPGQGHEGQSDLLAEAQNTADMLFSICDGTFAGDNGELHAQASKLQREINKVTGNTADEAENAQ